MQPLGEMLRGALNLHQQGRLAEAEQLYTKVLAVDARQFDALHLLGMLKHQRGDSAQALRLLAAAVESNPKSPDALLTYGGVLSATNRHEDALSYFDRALAIKPNRADAHYNRGNVLIALNRHVEALASYDRALALKPNDPLALYNRGNALIALDRLEEALAAYDRVLALMPNHPDALINRGKALKNLNRSEEALACFDRVLALRPDDVLAHINRGLALAALNRPEEALACYDRALALAPDDIDALHNRGAALIQLNRQEEALACCNRLLALMPENADGHWNAALARLTLGDLAKGWKEYEWRWKAANFPSKPRNFPQPHWNGERLNGTLLAWGEQGLGDEILYAGMIPGLAGHADSVVLEVEPRLAKLFARSYPDVRVIGRGEPLPENIKAQSPLASLGQYLRPSLEVFPRRERGYLTPDAGMAASLRRRLSPNGEVVIGLSWVSKNPSIGKFKTARLSDFEPVLRLPGCRFIDLQYGDTLAEREALKQAMGLVVERLEDVDNTKDLDALAALITACDLVVTVSNTTAHLAGALGKPTVVLVPFGQSRFWYWFAEGSNSPWYPHVRIRRTAREQSWEELIASAADEIGDLVLAATRSQPA